MSSAQDAQDPRRIAIIGAGIVGLSLAKRQVQAGYSVSISNSRGPDSIRKQVEAVGAIAMDAPSAVARADIVFLAVPVSSIRSLKALLGGSLRPGAIVVDSCNYYPSRDGHVEELDKGAPDSQWVAETISVPVIKAFNNIIAPNIVTSGKPKGHRSRVALPVSGDSDGAVSQIKTLIDNMGFDALHAGPLSESWRQQPGQPAYCTEPTLQELTALLARADRKQGVINRDKSRAMVEKLPADYSPQILLRVSRLAVGMDMWSPATWFSAARFAFALIRYR